MAWTLEQDKGTGELRQVHTDLWQGSHERKEWRVTGSAGRVLRRTDYALPQTLEIQNAPEGMRWYFRPGWRNGSDARIYITAEREYCASSKVPCRCLASKNGRARCAVCDAS